MGRHLVSIARYILRRIFWGVFALWGLSTLMFLLLSLFPGGPFDQDLALDPSVREALVKFYGLSGSLQHRYFDFLSAALHGNLGLSLYYPGQTVQALLERGLKPTLQLDINALLLAIVGGLFFGMIPHLSTRTATFFRTLVRAGLSLPVLFLGPMLIWAFCFRLDWFPMRFDGSYISMLLPIFLLALRPICGLARILDTQLGQAREQDFARTLKSLGVSEFRLTWRWLLRCGLISFVQQLPAITAGMISGSLLVETLFGIQGLGFFLMQSMFNRDWSLAIGLTILFGSLQIIGQIVADLLSMWLDPRLVIN